MHRHSLLRHMCLYVVSLRREPEIHFEQRDDCVRFWVRLPSLHHADVCVNHDADGNATINIEAVPGKNSPLNLCNKHAYTHRDKRQRPDGMAVPTAISRAREDIMHRICAHRVSFLFHFVFG